MTKWALIISSLNACDRSSSLCVWLTTNDDDEGDDEDEDEVSPLAPRSTNPKPSFSCFCKTTVFCSVTQSLWRKWRALLKPFIISLLLLILTAARFIMTDHRYRSRDVFGAEWRWSERRVHSSRLLPLESELTSLRSSSQKLDAMQRPTTPDACVTDARHLSVAPLQLICVYRVCASSDLIV